MWRNFLLSNSLFPINSFNYNPSDGIYILVSMVIQCLVEMWTTPRDTIKKCTKFGESLNFLIFFCLLRLWGNFLRQFLN